MNTTTRGGLCTALVLGASLLCLPAANAANDKPKAAATDSAPAQSASAPKPTAKKTQKAQGEKVGTASPGSADTGKGGNVAGYKKPSPPKQPQDATAKKAAVQQ